MYFFRNFTIHFCQIRRTKFMKVLTKTVLLSFIRPFHLMLSIQDFLKTEMVIYLILNVKNKNQEWKMQKRKIPLWQQQMRPNISYRNFILPL